MANVNGYLLYKKFININQTKDYLLSIKDSDVEIDPNVLMKSISGLNLSDDELDDFYAWCVQHEITLQKLDDVVDFHFMEEADDIEVDEFIIENQLLNNPSPIKDPLRKYYDEIGQFPSLNEQEEIDLAKKIQNGKNAMEILKTVDEENEHRKELQEMVRIGDEAKETLISANLRLVVSIAKRYIGQGILFFDLIHEGNYGLVKAVDRFDYSKGFKFSLYASWWICRYITRTIAKKSIPSNISVHEVNTVRKVLSTRNQLTQELGRRPSAQEIVEKMENITVEQVQEILDMLLEEDDTQLVDFIEEETNTSDECDVDPLLKDEIEEILQGLSDKEKKILCLRYGLIDGKRRSLDEIGPELNITRERVRQIEAKVKHKLKNRRRSKRLKEFLES